MKIIKFNCCLLICFLIAFDSMAQNKETQLAVDNYNKYYSEAKEYKATKEELKGINYFRDLYSQKAYRGHELNGLHLSVEEIILRLDDDGRFSDMIEPEKELIEKSQDEIGLFVGEAFKRVWKIAEEFRSDRMGYSIDKKVFRKCLKAILHYGNIEISRKNVSGRFHSSCFMIPTCAVNTYFCFIKQMEKTESGKNNDELLASACDMLKIIGLQAWTQPLRNDFTDDNVVQIERFRKHVWWVGGNGLAYRSLLPVAAMYKSVPMINVLSAVCKNGISGVSQNTYDSAFWSEGCTEDGAGWGHGMQCLIWGYPIDGNLSALNLLTSFKGSCWENKLDEKNIYYLMNFIQGSNWYYYKGYPLPFLHRGTFEYLPKTSDIRSLSLAKTLLRDWADSFNINQLNELDKFQNEAVKRNINMEGMDKGLYSGTRWFFNNDDLIKKNSRYHIMVNMASVRCDGLESASHMADGYNFFPCDGMTLFQKDGNEYYKVFGAWDVTATPGVTAREGMDRLVPVINWRGYCSKYNFAGGATNGGENAVAGFIFEKMNCSEKGNVNDKGDNAGKNESIYGVKAYKSFFMLGDYFIALGAGIENTKPELSGIIRTTIDQTQHEKRIVAMQNGKTIPVGKGKWSFLVGGKPVWVMQENKFAYTILPQYTKNAFFEYSTKKTDWIKYNGHKPINDTYGYVVYAGDNVPDENLPFKVLRNDTSIQAIISNDNKLVEAVFYNEKEKIDDSCKLSVSSPCIVLIDNNTLTLEDPTMNPELKHITVFYNDKEYVVDMPQGRLCGKPVTVQIK